MVTANAASSEQNIGKNLLGHRMHVEGPQIYQMNRKNNGFQNVCDRL